MSESAESNTVSQAWLQVSVKLLRKGTKYNMGCEEIVCGIQLHPNAQGEDLTDSHISQATCILRRLSNEYRKGLCL